LVVFEGIEVFWLLRQMAVAMLMEDHGHPVKPESLINASTLQL
jgi:hypothetical protein